MAKENREREDRIHNEIIADAHDSEERAMGWYCYLQDSLTLFTAKCTMEREISPLNYGDEVEVTGMAGENECQHEMFVTIQWERNRELAVPLTQLKPAPGTEGITLQAVQDWQYWMKQGYQL